MLSYGYRQEKHCRWCGKPYNAKKPIGRDGFCSQRCKQAHYRAYKKYITEKRLAAEPGPARLVTQKKQKKPKK